MPGVISFYDQKWGQTLRYPHGKRQPFGSAMCITDPGRFFTSTTQVKHNIKPMDRLVGNAILYNEKFTNYT